MVYKSSMIFSFAVLMQLSAYSDSFSRQTLISTKQFQNTLSLTVQVDKLRNSKGNIQFSLYNKDGTIPDEKFKKYFKQLKAEINNFHSTVTFNNLPKGRYAITILHDENSNGKIDKGFFLPVEGVGFSRFKSIGLTNKPNFSKASFDLKTNTTKSIQIIYF